MKDNPKKFEEMVRREVQEFSQRPSEGFWMGLSSRMDVDLGAPTDGGTTAPADGNAIPGSGLEHWLLQTFNINLITMITVGSLTLTVGVLFFTGTSQNASINTNNSNPNATTSIEQPITSTDDLAGLAPSPLNDPMPDPMPSQKKTIIIPIINEDTSENIILEGETPEPLNSEEKEDSIKTVDDVQNTLQPEVVGRNAIFPCNTEVRLGDKINPFRSELERLLAQNNPPISVKSKVRIQYQRNKITINNEAADQNKQLKYIELMQRYGITPCEDRIVQLTDEYIAIGEVTDEGFRGQLQGSVDLDELNGTHDQPKGRGKANIQGKNKTGKEQILVLKNTDTRPVFDRMLEKLKSYGFKIKSSSFNQNNGLITSIKIHLTHSQGMDWQLKGRKFDTLEFRIKVDNSGKATDLHYQFNEEKLNKIGLTGTGSTSHSY